LIETIPRAEIEFTTAQTRTARSANIKTAHANVACRSDPMLMRGIVRFVVAVCV
jgi:hypothetical protein